MTDDATILPLPTPDVPRPRRMLQPPKDALRAELETLRATVDDLTDKLRGAAATIEGKDLVIDHLKDACGSLRDFLELPFYKRWWLRLTGNAP